jgi:cyclophilin family peptidyl-prolyl cis-trans isomerase
VQLQTSMGNLNLELHCDIAMRTAWNFITLCQRGFYDGVPFHRLVPGFMLQGDIHTYINTYIYIYIHIYTYIGFTLHIHIY